MKDFVASFFHTIITVVGGPMTAVGAIDTDGDYWFLWTAFFVFALGLGTGCGLCSFTTRRRIKELEDKTSKMEEFIEREVKLYIKGFVDGRKT